MSPSLLSLQHFEELDWNNVQLISTWLNSIKIKLLSVNSPGSFSSWFTAECLNNEILYIIYINIQTRWFLSVSETVNSGLFRWHVVWAAAVSLRLWRVVHVTYLCVRSVDQLWTISSVLCVCSSVCSTLNWNVLKLSCAVKICWCWNLCEPAAKNMWVNESMELQ